MMQPLLLLALPHENADNLLLIDELALHYTGVGKVNAAIAATKLLSQATSPQLVINAGSAGSHTLNAGQVVVATQFHQRDMDATAMGFGLGETPFEPEVILTNGLTLDGYTHTTCYTGDSFVTSKHPTLDMSVIDMEAYAIAKVCQKLGHRFICLKFITDGADGQAANEWSEAVKMAAAQLQPAIAQAIHTHRQ